MLIFNWTWWRHPGPLRRPVRGAGRRSLRWGWLLLLLGVLCADARAQVQVQVQGELERQVKAAYLYKFAGYVEWPDASFARPDSPLVIGVAGADALAEQLEQSVAGHSVNGRTVQVKKVRRGEALAGLHVLYLGALEKTALQEMLAASRGLALLTVSDSDEVYAMGSMINFVMAEDKVRFDVALKPVAQAHIRISARMLLAAYRVQTGGA
ncbi:YfiR family protein [Janthinobacterium sp. LB2P49]|uniref:YfiR family protein n=1 Tax=Janthinobacterium sp. LB2P49 TaxID=3424198 RepID=UPI003F290B3D